MKRQEKRNSIGKNLARAAMVVAALVILGFLTLNGGRNGAGSVLAPGSIVQAASAEQVPEQTQAPESAASQDVQKVRTSLEYGYEPITVTAGVPVEWTIDAPDGSINGCNYVMQAPALNIEHEFTPGENVIRFTPDAAGTYSYSCWMGMINSTITVVEPGAATDGEAAPEAPAAAITPGSCPCCG